MSNECMPTSNEENWKKIVEGFQHRANFPHYLGAVDGKRIRITPSLSIKSLIVNRLQKLSTKPRPIRIVLQSTSDVFQILKVKRQLLNVDKFKNIRISFIRTLQQRKLFSSIASDLKLRKDIGKTGLFIKFINNCPTISMNETLTIEFVKGRLLDEEAKKITKKNKKTKTPRIIPISKKGEVLPLIPFFAGLSVLDALAGSVANVVKVINDLIADRNIPAHLGKGMYLMLYKCASYKIEQGKGLYLAPHKRGSGSSGTMKAKWQNSVTTSQKYTKQRKLSVRMILQQVLIEEIERRNTYKNSSKSSTCIPNFQSQHAKPTNVNENYNLQYLSSAQHRTDTTPTTDFIFSDL
ncbi:Hypothetical protein CINCED_3A024184 [Cinara cedri]|uniref:Uncharacterized protein n=1 Tax=Cinara cedri TaxID=506608 RepID=A0A5E4N3X6_9HEMI|nr:Hypothetical protein CINCED_3A024184 [Cinara cedri]